MHDGKTRDAWAIPVLLLAAAALHADQSLPAPNLSQIARSFDFTPEERDAKLGGEVSAGFFVLGGICSLFAGGVADTSSDRIHWFFWTVLCGMLPCVLTALTPEGRGGYQFYLG